MILGKPQIKKVFFYYWSPFSCIISRQVHPNSICIQITVSLQATQLGRVKLYCTLSMFTILYIIATNNTVHANDSRLFVIDFTKHYNKQLFKVRMIYFDKKICTLQGTAQARNPDIALRNNHLFGKLPSFHTDNCFFQMYVYSFFFN